MLENEYPMIFSVNQGSECNIENVFYNLCKREEKLNREIDRVQRRIIKTVSRDENSHDQTAPKLKAIPRVQSSPLENEPKKEKKVKKTKSKQKLLAMTPLDPNYKIRFHYKCADLERVEETPGCPVVRIFKNGDRELTYKDGTVMIFHENMKFTYFANGDRMQEFQDGASAYKYYEQGTIEFKTPNGVRVVQYSNGRRDRISESGEVTTTFHVTGRFK